MLRGCLGPPLTHVPPAQRSPERPDSMETISRQAQPKSHKLSLLPVFADQPKTAISIHSPQYSPLDLSAQSHAKGQEVGGGERVPPRITAASPPSRSALPPRPSLPSFLSPAYRSHCPNSPHTCTYTLTQTPTCTHHIHTIPHAHHTHCLTH